MDTTTQRVAAEVRAAMARHRVNQEAMAAHLGMSQAAVSRRLRGEVDWTIPELEAAATFLGVRLTVLLDDATQAAS